MYVRPLFFIDSKEAMLPVLLSLVAFFLSLAGWWLAWLAGLIVLVLWLVLLLFMDYVPHLHAVLLTALVSAVIAAAGEMAIVFNVNHGATCGNADENCKHLSPPLKMILAAIAAILWGIVVYLTFQKYRAITVTTTTTTDQGNNKNGSIRGDGNTDANV